MGIEKKCLLIEYLMNQEQPITAKELAGYLGVSIRTVKNYISDINGNKGSIILSGFTGYEVNKQLAVQYLKNRKNLTMQVPQDYEERANYINLAFFMRHTDRLDIFDLSEELNFSIETIKSDLAKMNKSFESFGVSYEIHSNYVYLKARESALRMLSRYTLFFHVQDSMISYSTVQEVFPEINIDLIKTTVHYILEKEHYYVNDFGLINLVLNMAIIIRRVKNGKTLTIGPKFLIENVNGERKAVLDICDKLEKVFDIELNGYEKEAIYLLFKSNVNIVLPKEQEDVHEYVGEELFKFIEVLVEKISTRYYVDLNNKSFILPFSLHIKNLIFRVQNNQQVVGNIINRIKFAYPLIFDMAVYASQIICKTYKIEMDENEVSYLALHIGGELERQEMNNEKVRVLLLCPNYLEFSVKMYNQMLINFSNDMELVACINTPDQIYKHKFELLVTTLDIDLDNADFETIHVPILGIQRNKAQIEEKIEQIKENRRTWVLKNEFHRFFNEDLFFVNYESNLTKEQAMRIVSEKMMEKGLVLPDYYERLLEREKAASTGFPKIAIPHSMKMDAIKTSIGVMLCPNGIKWDNQIVKVVLVVAIHEMDAKIFGNLYQALIRIFDNEKNLRIILKTTKFYQFAEIIAQMI